MAFTRCSHNSGPTFQQQFFWNTSSFWSIKCNLLFLIIPHQFCPKIYETERIISLISFWPSEALSFFMYRIRIFWKVNQALHERNISSASLKHLSSRYHQDRWYRQYLLSLHSKFSYPKYCLMCPLYCRYALIYH